MMKRVFVLLVTVILVALFAACSDDDDDKSSGPVLAPEQVLTVTQVEIPSALSKASDPKVKEAVDWIRTANALAETMAPMLRPQADGAGARPAGPRLASAVSDTVVWNWHPYAELQATLTWWECDTAYHWILSWDGTAQIGGEHLVFNDFKLVEATESKDGTLGFWFVYGIEYSPDPIFQWEWHIDASGNFSLTAGVPDEGWYIVLEVNSDDTGTISYFEDNQIELRAIWNADGSGQWWEYENGSLIDSGSWV
jgi:hypothetical protein